MRDAVNVFLFLINAFADTMFFSATVEWLKHRLSSLSLRKYNTHLNTKIYNKFLNYNSSTCRELRHQLAVTLVCFHLFRETCAPQDCVLIHYFEIMGYTVPKSWIKGREILQEILKKKVLPSEKSRN